MSEGTRIYWVPQADPQRPDHPTATYLDGAARLAGFVAVSPDPVPAERSMTEILLEMADCQVIPPTTVQRLLREASTTPDQPSGVDLLDRIDRAIDDLCPCGAQPREGSAYCSYDCEPNIVGEHTDRRESGHLATPMRWRPDLVTAAPDEGLTVISGRFATGDGSYRSVFRRPGGTLHFRLDDGHRFVGCDIAEEFQNPDGYITAWERLERQLTDPRHVVPIEPDRESFIESVLPLALAAGFMPRTENLDTLWSRWCSTCHSRCEPFSQLAGDWCSWCWTRIPGPPMNLSVSVDFTGDHHMQLGAYIGSQYRSVERVVTEAELQEARLPLDVVRATWAAMEDELLAAAGIVRATARRHVTAGQMLTSDDVRMTGRVYVPPLTRAPYGSVVSDRVPSEMYRITGIGA